MSTTLWLCLWLPQLPLEALGNADADTVVYAQRGSRRWVTAARHPRIARGEALGSVQARFPDLKPCKRNPQAEQAALEAVACMAYRFGDHIVISAEEPRVALDAPFLAVSVEIGASLRLFGGLTALLDAVRGAFQGGPYQVLTGVAPTLEAAALLARLEHAPLGSGVGLREALANLPIGALRWPLEVLEVLRGTGHETLGDVLRHDSASLAARFGPALPQALDRLTGQSPDLRPLYVPPEHYRRRLDLGVELDDTESLLFPLRRVFAEFEGYLAARQTAVCEVRLRLSRHRGLAQDLRLRTTRPTRDAATLLRLVREVWNGRPPNGPVGVISLQAERFVDPQANQADLFTDPAQAGDAWGALVDRLRARLGGDAVWRPGLADDHRPEKAWAADGLRIPPQRPLPPRPLWLLSQPRPVEGALKLKTPAERIETGWWDENPIARDYHAAENAAGQRLWVYRNLHDDRWYLHGFR